MKPNILVLTSRFPFPLEKGDKLRVFHQIKCLSNHFNVFLFSISEEDIHQTSLDQLKPYVSDLVVCKKSKLAIYYSLVCNVFSSEPYQVSYFYSKRAQKHLDAKVKEWKIDAVFCQLIRMSKYVEGIQVWKALDYMDAFSLGLERRLNATKGLQRFIVKQEYERVSSFEKQLLNQFNKTYIIATKDKRCINSESISILKNGVDTSYFHPKENNQKSFDIVFVGNMQYYPNVLAAQVLINEILPICNTAGFKLKILIAGANPTKDVKALASPHVTVSGWMDDIREAYWNSSLFVAPLFTGSGLQNKVLEAMSCKIPVISTSIVNDSLGAREKQEIFIGDSPQQISEEIIKLLENRNSESIIKTINQAKQFVENTYGWQANTQILIDDIKEGVEK
ncbi:MAG: glycosyltransferase [Flavobacteriales bacterium]